MSRTTPLSGSDAMRIAFAATGRLLDREIHTTRPHKRVFMENQPVGPQWLGEIASEAAMVALRISHERSCFAMDMCYRTDTTSIWLCINARGEMAGDWLEFGSGGGGSSAAIGITYNNASSGLAATNVQAAIDELVELLTMVADDQEASEVPYNNTTSTLTATNVQTAIDELAAASGVVTANVLAANVGLTVALTVPNETDTPIEFDIENLDNGKFFDLAAPSRLTALTNGLFGFGACIKFAAHATGFRRLKVVKNGTTVIVEQSGMSITTTDETTELTLAFEMLLLVDDYIEIMAYQNSGGALNVLTDSSAWITKRGWIITDPGTNPDPDTLAWETALIAAGGTLEIDSFAIADALIVELKTALGASYSKIIYFLPLLGSNLLAAMQPLIDTLSRGRPTNTGFSNSDFSQGTGIQGANNKIWELPLTPGDLNATDQRGGIGVWELNTTRTGADNYVLSCSGGVAFNDFSYGLQLYATSDIFYWGSNANARWVEDLSQVVGGWHYGQRSATNLLEFYDNTGQAGTNTAEHTPASMNVNIRFMGHSFYGGTLYSDLRMGCAIMTDGTLTAGEIATLQATLLNFLINPTGR